MTTAHDSPDSAELAPPQDDLATRKTLGPYELKKKLGQGGMGAVYLAVDPALKRQVALKILPREKASNPQLVKRFKAEAQNASLLTHDNIVSVYGAGEADGYLYIALEYIDGIDVHDLVQRRGILPVKRSIDIIKQVARALQHALDQGIVHRDIKPANLLIRRDGMVKLADMGLARAVDETMETGITRAGTTVGTVDYMSPEQARNSKAADVRSDMYSLGCTWYHMLTGTPPYADGSLVNKLNAHAKQPPPDPRDKNEAVPEGVVAVMQRMLAKNPDDRYQTPNELIKDLEGALVNRDAVSQRILEAIDDDSVHGDEDDYPAEEAPSHAASQSDQPDAYPVQMPWSDSIEEMPSPSAPATGSSARPAARRQYQGEEPEAPDDEPVESSPRPATGKSKPPPTTSPARSTSTSSPGPRHSAPPPTPQPTTTTSHKSTSSTQKPAPTSSRHGSTSSKSSAAPGNNRPHSLPPPKRKSANDTGDQGDGAKSSPLKLVITALAIAAGIGVLIFLAHLANMAGEATAPAVVVNPYAGGAPPPPPPPGVAAPTTEGDEAAAADGQNKKVKDILIERQDDEGNSALGQGAKPGGTQNVAAIATGPPKFVPDWANNGFESVPVPMFSVRKGPTVESERRYATLQEAFKSAGSVGARIVLFHDGPFDLVPSEIPSAFVIIEAAQGFQPQIKLVAEGEHRKLPWMNVTNGSLALDGVNFIGEEGAVPVGDPWSWIRVTNGHLYVRRSSFTLNGKRSAPTTILKLAGVVTDPVTKEVTVPRFLLDQSVVRGENIRCVQLESPGFEGVIRQSLLIAGDAPAITIRGADKALPKTTRQLKFENATVSSREQALFLSAQGTINPIETEVLPHATLFAAPANAPNPVLLYLEDWPPTKPRPADAPPYKNLRWSATGSAVLGFRPLLKLSNDDAAAVTDGAGWKKLFKDELPTTYSSLNWPTDVPGGNALAPLKTWSLKSLDALPLSFPVPDVTPGCPVTNLRAPDLADASKTAAKHLQRPRPPIPFAAKAAQQVDLNKNVDLGKLLASKEWEDGTVFVASGSGQRYSSPINVERHKWRIQFHQTEGQPLVISPRAGPRSGGDNGAFITVRGGQLDVEHGTFQYDLKEQQSLTPWFLYAEGGGFALSNCRIQMPQAAANRNRGIIRWAAPETPEKTPPDNEFANYAQITDSLLAGNGMLISADLPQRAVLLNNSAFVSRQNLFEWNVGLNDGQAPAAVDAQNCTFLSSGTQWTIKSLSPAGSHPLPSRFANRNCVFAAFTPEANAKTTPLLMNYSGLVAAADQIVWYEESCGYSPDLKSYYAADGMPATGAQDFEKTWAQRWGAERVQRPLVGPNGVLFEKNLAGSFTQFRMETLQFHKTAKARTWSESGGPIGVRLAALEPPPAPPKAVPGGKTAPGSKKQPMNKSQPKITF